MEEKKTATRTSLSQEWLDLNRKVDWMQAPYMAEYVNGLVSGKSLNDGGHWAIYARDKFVSPLIEITHNNISMVSLACGSGHIEESLVKDFGWPIKSFLGLEYDGELRKAAVERFNKIKTCSSNFKFFDFNKEFQVAEQFDIVFTCHSIHHAADLEKLLNLMNRLLKPGGLIIGIDYFGPTRFQIEYDVYPIIREIFSYLPEDLRRDLRTPEMKILNDYDYDTIETVKKFDISESIRSSDLRTLLFSNFPVIEIKPMGGTILRWLLANRAGNFRSDNPYHVTIIRLIQYIERQLIYLNKIKSDDLFFVLRKSERV